MRLREKLGRRHLTGPVEGGELPGKGGFAFCFFLGWFSAQGFGFCGLQVQVGIPKFGGAHWLPKNRDYSNRKTGTGFGLGELYE